MNDYDNQLATLIAQKFVARRDVKAVQVQGGGYRPVDEPWKLSDVKAHIAGERTYGHYVVDGEQSKLLTFDCDLIDGPDGMYVELPEPMTLADLADDRSLIEHCRLRGPLNVREAWKTVGHPARPWLAFQMRSLAELLSMTIRQELGIPVAAAYTGNKGVHVYGFTGLASSKDVREAAQLVLGTLGRFTQLHGENFFRDTSEDWYDNFSNFSIEVFPKQDTVKPGGYGNLVRLPLGTNQKRPEATTFFIDQRRPHAVLAPHPDPVALLTGGDPWAA